MEQVGKRQQGGVLMVVYPFAHVFGQVQRQRPVGAEQAETEDRNVVQRAVGARRHLRQRGGRERQRRLLAQAQHLVARQRRTPQQVGLAALGVDAPQQLKQIVLVRRAAQPRPEVVRQAIQRVDLRRRQFGGDHLRAHISVLLPMRACQWAISPRCWLESVISVKVFIATRRENRRSSTLPSR